LVLFSVLLMAHIYNNETIRDRIATNRTNSTIFQKIMRRGLLRSLEFLGAVARNIRLEGTTMQYSRPAEEPIERSLLYVTELLHRVRNDYTRTISLASTMGSQSSEAKKALGRIVEHLHASANAYHLLSPRPPGSLVDFTEDVSGLCRAMAISTLEHRGITLHLATHRPIIIDGFRCWRANLILSELITNASRHAFRERGGSISVALAIARGQVVCSVDDDGSSPKTPKSGLGTQIIDALTKDLEGDIARRYTRSGTAIILRFPMISASPPRLVS
jgi:two-component sensor histidine kinase